MAPEKFGNWINGVAGLVFQRCPQCDHVWYFRRKFCPRCGRDQPLLVRSKGLGTVHALSMVHRSPSAELRARVPYLIVVVDADEGFRLMAHGEASLAIGDRVRVCFPEFGGRIIPCFEKIRS